MSFDGREAEPGGVAIEAHGLSKFYQIYARPEDRLKQMLWHGRRRYYREFFALRDVDIRVMRGETVGIVGRNGSGKSTLLKILCGVLEPSAGSLAVHGHLAPLLALGAGFNPEFSGRDNVLMNAAVLGISDEQVAERMDSIIAFADIGAFLDEPVRSYSSGMYARLAFAVAIHSDPEILVIDEILAVGDEAFTRKCFARIQQIKAQGSTILCVSHSTSMITELCDRAVLLDGGLRLLTADPKTVVSQYRRLAHAPPAQVARVRDEIAEIDRDPAAARRAATTTEVAAVELSGDAEDVADVPAAASRATFDPHMKPSSTVTYEARGARITNVRVIDARDRRVNVLEPGGSYSYIFDVAFDEAATGVRFGMMLKLVTGFELGGQVSAALGSGIPFVERGATVRVRFRFRALLAPGAYFANAGVLALDEDDEVFLHRVLDAVMFRVDARPSDAVTGRVDLSDGAPEIRVLTEPTSGDARATRRSGS